MKPIGLIIGETASLPKEIIKKFQMIFVPFATDWPEGKDLPGKDLFQKMREGAKKGIKNFPKTSQPSIGNYKEAFEKALSKFEKTILITVSSKLSGAYNTACFARRMLSQKMQERIEIIDSQTGSAGEGLLVFKTAQLIEKGKKGFNEIVLSIKQMIPEIHLFCMLEDPKWLEVGGRLSHPLAVLLRQMQKIGMRPLIGTKNGMIKPVSLKIKAKDVPTALFKELKNETRKKLESGKKIIVAISHADNLKGAKRLQKMIEKRLNNTKIAFLSLVDPVIGVHSGPGTLLCAWTEEDL
ncbi:MAG TPA: DegV family protein [Candidatus Pacearchaeota archaeon]|nr:DegV family protein [Candidatus Pacearchaeota archaeon]HPZ74689.1 DegV family protein [Candidatus Pacearchaeota archaeon]HQD89295.1 DegV family protein [Candidatus Pacearchaeota archaeon]